MDLGNVALGIPPSDTGTRESLYYRERSVTLSLNQLLGKYFSVGASYRFSDAEFQEHFVELTALSPSPDRDESATLQQVNLSANFNHASGLFAQAGESGRSNPILAIHRTFRAMIFGRSTLSLVIAFCGARLNCASVY